MSIADEISRHSPEQREAWRRRAVSQGIVCLVCGTPPLLHRREVFYDTGLCWRCEADLDESGALRTAEPDPA